ncbi:MAG: hypothetical protein PVF43_05195 [Candidatus Eiseniibacteriota bacterium]|jgi:hypothetical protein
MMMRRTLFCLTVLAVAGWVTAASAGDRWLHVRVDESGRHGERVRVQLPLKMIQAILPAIETEAFQHGRVQLGNEDLDAADLRAMLEAVRDAADGEYARIESHDERVRVAKQDDFLHVQVEERDAWDDASEVVRVRIPMVVVEAMLAGHGDEIDLAAGIEALDSLGQMELVTVDDGDSRVRIWIDEQSLDLDDDADHEM